MRTLVFLACSLTLAVLAVPAGAADPAPGSLSVDQGRGVLVLELRGTILGRLGSGTLRVTDLTPRDPFGEIVTGKNLLPEERVGPRTDLYRGQGLRFRMIGGRYRIRVAGTGIALSAVGRGAVVLDGEPRFLDDSTGLYSLTEGVDCSLEPTLCTPLPDEPERYTLPTASEGG
jgi:hypothetical protein